MVHFVTQAAVAPTGGDCWFVFDEESGEVAASCFGRDGEEVAHRRADILNTQVAEGTL
jgi:hypothetical protein